MYIMKVYSCNSVKLVYGLVSLLMLGMELSENNGTLSLDTNLMIDLVVWAVTTAMVLKLCKDKKYLMAYGVIALHVGYWVIKNSDNQRDSPTEAEVANAMNAMNAAMNGNATASDVIEAVKDEMNSKNVETFQRCELTGSGAGEFCDGDYSDARNGVGAFAGVAKKCGTVGHCNMAKYYERRADWVEQQDLSMPDSPPVVAPNCLSDSPLFPRPCSAVDTPATKLRHYPINTDTHQPPYRLCHENSAKVQIGFDPHARPYEAAENV